jgi:hypothetical protein
MQRAPVVFRKPIVLIRHASMYLCKRREAFRTPFSMRKKSESTAAGGVAFDSVDVVMPFRKGGPMSVPFVVVHSL